MTELNQYVFSLYRPIYVGKKLLITIVCNKLNTMQNTNDINNTNINNIVNEIGTLFTNSAQASFSAKQVHAYSKPVSNKNKRWLNNDCKKARKNFHRAKFLYKLHRTESHKNNLNIKSKIYKQTLSKSFKSFQNQNASVLKKMCKSNPKQFWKYLNPRKTSKCKSSLSDMFEYF